MANKPLQSIKFPDLPDTYTIPVVDSTLAVSGAAADAKQTGDSLSDKVDKVSGKGLSTNDYTDEEKTKLAGVETGANKTVIDTTLTQTGQAADAKAVGDAIASEDKKALAAFATDTASGAVANFPDGADSIPMKDVLVHIEPVQAGSGDPSPDNVRPITGWTGVKVTRMGRNILPPYKDASKEASGIIFTNDNGRYTINGTSTSRVSLDIDLYLPAGTYTLAGFESLNTDMSVYIITADIEVIADITLRNNTVKTFTISKDASIVRFTVADKVTVNGTVNLEIVSGSTTLTEWEPYQGDTYDITFPSEAGTVYGGTLDVTKGELVVDRETISLKDIAWTYDAGVPRFYSFALQNKIKKPTRSTDVAELLCTHYKTVSFDGNNSLYSNANKSCAVSTGGTINVRDESYTTASELKDAMGNAQFCYELATPITYTLTPQEITSLLGTNNLWADTGDSDVEYRANTVLWVQRKITEAVAAVLNS